MKRRRWPGRLDPLFVALFFLALIAVVMPTDIASVEVVNAP